MFIITGNVIIIIITLWVDVEYTCISCLFSSKISLVRSPVCISVLDVLSLTLFSTLRYMRDFGSRTSGFVLENGEKMQE